MTQNDRSGKHTILFMELVASFQLSALQCLGKLVDSRTGKSDVNLDGAAASIDMLDMLTEKTKGNLSPDEAKFMEQTLSHLKLNYVEETNKPKSEETPPPSEEKAPDPDQPPQTPSNDEEGEAES
jgi:hypothetical protein